MNRLFSHKAPGRVDNDSLENLVSAVDFAWMGSFEVILNQREVLEHRHIAVMLIGVRICRQESVVNRSVASEPLDLSGSY